MLDSIDNQCLMIKPGIQNLLCDAACYIGLQVTILRVLVDPPQGLQHGVSSCKHPVCQQERVEEVNTEKSQVCQALQ